MEYISDKEYNDNINNIVDTICIKHYCVDVITYVDNYLKSICKKNSKKISSKKLRIARFDLYILLIDLLLDDDISLMIDNDILFKQLERKINIVVDKYRDNNIEDKITIKYDELSNTYFIE